LFGYIIFWRTMKMNPEVLKANIFMGSLPSSFLAATLGYRLFTPRNRLQKYICVFSISPFSQVLKSSLSHIPQTPEKKIVSLVQASQAVHRMTHNPFSCPSYFCSD